MRWFFIIMSTLAIMYCSLSIREGYKMAQLDKEIGKPVEVILGNGTKLLYSREGVQTWCSLYERDIYGFDLRKIGCRLGK